MMVDLGQTAWLFCPSTMRAFSFLGGGEGDGQDAEGGGEGEEFHDVRLFKQGTVWGEEISDSGSVRFWVEPECCKQRLTDLGGHAFRFLAVGTGLWPLAGSAPLLFAAGFVAGGELLLAEEKAGEEFLLDPVKTGLESLFVVDSADFGFHGGGIALKAQEIVGGEANKSLAIEAFALGEDPSTHIKSENGIADPGFFALLSEGVLVNFHGLLVCLARFNFGA